ncbi:hypothetical protein [Glutamicibacter ardleyensis]|uniref:hypothetical protein n=1 Tax=Glutamicibacter ardleyensis TaxID=225894 RepID=UPI003FD57A4C
MAEADQHRRNRMRLEVQALTELLPDVIYEMVDKNGNTEKGESWGTSPDGVGMHWYESREQCVGEFMDAGDSLPHVSMTEDEFESMRYA